MIKSHLFEQAHPDVLEAQSKWSTIRSTIAGLGKNTLDDPLLGYLHSVSIILNGPIKADDIFDVMENTVAGRTQSLAFLASMATFANDFAAIVTPSDAKWTQYDQRVRTYVHNISQEIKMSFIRSLMLAVAAPSIRKRPLEPIALQFVGGEISNCRRKP